jgi:hypothetical protein
MSTDETPGWHAAGPDVQVFKLCMECVRFGLGYVCLFPDDLFYSVFRPFINMHDTYTAFQCVGVTVIVFDEEQKL